MYELFKIVSVIAIILWALRDKIDEPRNVKYCCNKGNETKIELSLIEAPSDDDTPVAQPFIADETPVTESIVNMPVPEPFVVYETPAAESTVDMPADESIDDESIVDDEPEEDILSIEDLYGDYTDLLMPSIMLRLSNNTSVNNTFVSRTPRNNCFGVVHASI